MIGGALPLALLFAVLLGAPEKGAEGTARDAAAEIGLKFSSDVPTSIRADELEASRVEAGERVVFRGNVRVEQADLRIRCDRLEATYPRGRGGGPNHLVARGNVRILQGETQARCAEAVFDGVRNLATCRNADGRASLQRGDDIVEGAEIVFDMTESTVRVTGGAVVRMQPREEKR
jgi:lipopolysaccharide transport protein LptA